MCQIWLHKWVGDQKITNLTPPKVEGGENFILTSFENVPYVVFCFGCVMFWKPQLKYMTKINTWINQQIFIEAVCIRSKKKKLSLNSVLCVTPFFFQDRKMFFYFSRHYLLITYCCPNNISLFHFTKLKKRFFVLKLSPKATKKFVFLYMNFLWRTKNF